MAKELPENIDRDARDAVICALHERWRNTSMSYKIKHVDWLLEVYEENRRER